MLKHIKIALGGLNVDIEYRNDVIARLCRNYAANFDTPDISVSYDQEGCKKEERISGHSGATAEFANIHRQIAENLPSFSRFVAHGATISYNNAGYMFIAKSGTGKTTHINLWKKYFDGVDIINGDKPLIRVTNNNIFAHGTPWSGKEMLNKNVCAPLKGICLIKRAKTNNIQSLSGGEALNALMKQVYMPANAEALGLTIGMFDDIIRLVPFYKLSCDISREAAICSFEAMTGERII